MRSITLIASILVLLVGCKTPKEPGALPPPEGDLAYLIGADPAAVTSAQLSQKVLEADFRARNYHVADGVFWQATRTSSDSPPDLYGSGGDSLLFTGDYLAACSYRYGVTRSTADLDKAIDALRGIYILTHASGAPGSLMRCAFQTGEEEKFSSPEHWEKIKAEGFGYDGPSDIDDPFNPGQKFPQMTFYSRVTRDQVTGLVYGLSVFWEVVTTDDVATTADLNKINQARDILAQTIHAVYAKLRADDWNIRDQTGRNDTSSDHIGKDLLRLGLLSLYRKTITDQTRAKRIQGDYEDVLSPIKILGFFPADPFNRFSNSQQYYAWNLRFTRAAAVWITADDDDKQMIADYIRKWLYKSVKGHKNAWFTLIHATASRDLTAAADGVLSLKSWSLRPVPSWCSPVANGWGDRSYDPPNSVDRVTGRADSKVLWPHLRKPTSYFIWQKGPWEAGRTKPVATFDTGTLGLLLPYWMARYHGLIQ